jgi:hypothetical protein
MLVPVLVFLIFSGAVPVWMARMESSAIAATPSRKSRWIKRRNKIAAVRRARLALAKLPPLRDGDALATELPAPKASLPPPSPPASPPHLVAQSPPARAASPARQLKSSVGRVRKVAPTDDELLQEAQASYIRGERQRAIDLALSVAEKDSETSTAAWRFIGLAACSVRSQRLATRAYQNLHALGDQRIITDACKHNGLSYHDEQFVGD